MSTATAETTEAAPAPKKSFGKKKLIVLLAIVVLLLAVAGGGVVIYLKKKAAQAAEEADGDPGAAQVEGHGVPKRDPKNVPTFVPLETFTVNLADREAERYAQIGLTLELEDPHVADQIKAYMPAIRNNILMVLAQKTSADLLDRQGKERLAFEIKREAARALGVEIEDELAAKVAAKPASGAASAAKPAKKRVYEPSPIRQVHFSNFIIQ
ncbi:flagellar basal body-associated FliL family protein [Ideonella sp. BN130291]|uniref:flagellar basal body-associated FliL family protein n=1 Tax=Ideonella sp. BN130291 TaxID=3112940 RepID=UPI002E25B90F|nr:flagellar basal body-associated FliL family protein [Ideonella sp. BN130291]